MGNNEALVDSEFHNLPQRRLGMLARERKAEYLLHQFQERQIGKREIQCARESLILRSSCQIYLVTLSSVL